MFAIVKAQNDIAFVDDITYIVSYKDAVDKATDVVNEIEKWVGEQQHIKYYVEKIREYIRALNLFEAILKKAKE